MGLRYFLRSPSPHSRSDLSRQPREETSFSNVSTRVILGDPTILGFIIPGSPFRVTGLRAHGVNGIIGFSVPRRFLRTESRLTPLPITSYRRNPRLLFTRRVGDTGVFSRSHPFVLRCPPTRYLLVLRN